MGGVDRNRVKHAFDQHAREYDAYACVQKQVIARLAGLLRGMPANPRRLIDIGAGTGMLLRVLAERYPAAELIGLDLAFGMSHTTRANLAARPSASSLTGDAEQLPFGNSLFDLVVSTSTFQWLESLDRVFAEAFRVLAPEGWFAFALFGERTLFELRTSYRAAWERTGRGSDERTHTFHHLSGVEETLAQAGFTQVWVTSELEVERHPDVPALLRSIRRIGAGNAAPARSPGLAERRVMLDMMNIYRREYAVDDLIPATYEVIYGMGRKNGITPPAARNT